MEVIADFLMDILPAPIGAWLAEHFFAKLLKKVKNDTLRMLISLVVVLLGFAIVFGFVLAVIYLLMLVMK